MNGGPQGVCAAFFSIKCHSFSYRFLRFIYSTCAKRISPDHQCCSTAHFTLVGNTRTARLIPYHLVKRQKPIWRSVPDPQMSSSDLAYRYGIGVIVPVMDARRIYSDVVRVVKGAWLPRLSYGNRLNGNGGDWWLIFLFWNIWKYHDLVLVCCYLSAAFAINTLNIITQNRNTWGNIYER